MTAAPAVSPTEPRRWVAITREVSRTLTTCELTHLDRKPIDLERARAQHHVYLAALAEAGCRVEVLPEEPDYPDAVFVEDTAVVVDELAVLTVPGAPSRRGETATIGAALRRFQPLAELVPPATLDGGDVLLLGRQLYVGLSSRSNRAGVEQLRQHLAPFGYTVEGIELGACLHLKTAVTEVLPGVLLLNPDWVAPALFPDHEVVAVDPAEPFAANVLRIGHTLIYPQAFPRTAARLRSTLAGQLAANAVRLIEVAADELAKAEGAVTCCSLVFSEAP